MRRRIIALSAVVIVGRVSACSTSLSPAALSQRSYKDGITAGEANWSRATSDAACQSMAPTLMRQWDIQQRWTYGCLAGGILGYIKADQARGSGS